jgi:hypothetical protein
MIHLKFRIFSESLENSTIAICDDLVTFQLLSIRFYGAFIDDSSTHFLLHIVCSPFSSGDVFVVAHIISSIYL